MRANCSSATPIQFLDLSASCFAFFFLHPVSRPWTLKKKQKTVCPFPAADSFKSLNTKENFLHDCCFKDEPIYSTRCLLTYALFFQSMQNIPIQACALFLSRTGTSYFCCSIFLPAALLCLHGSNFLHIGLRLKSVISKTGSESGRWWTEGDSSSWNQQYYHFCCPRKNECLLYLVMRGNGPGSKHLTEG